MDGTVRYKCLHLKKDPVIKVIEKCECNGLIMIRFTFPMPLTWHGDWYTYDPGYVVEECCTGESEEEAMQHIFFHVQTILAWEHRKAHENIGKLVQIENLKPISQSLTTT